jgi:hypothetical protein
LVVVAQSNEASACTRWSGEQRNRNKSRDSIWHQSNGSDNSGGDLHGCVIEMMLESVSNEIQKSNCNPICEPNYQMLLGCFRVNGSHDSTFSEDTHVVETRHSVKFSDEDFQPLSTIFGGLPTI